MRCGTTGMHDPLRNTFMIEMGDLLPQVEVLEKSRPATAGLQGMVGIRQPKALRGGQILPGLRPAVTGVRIRGGGARRAGRLGRALIWLTGCWHENSKDDLGRGGAQSEHY